MLRILIVDDEALLALTLKIQLGSAGFAVVGVAANGREAVELCRRHCPDVVLMDLRMPGMDGIEATRQIMAECPTRVVVLSALAEREALARAKEAGARAYLTKPASVEEVMRALEMGARGCPSGSGAGGGTGTPAEPDASG